MNWFILAGICLLIIVIFGVITEKTLYIWPVFVCAVSGIIFIVAIVVGLATIIEAPQEIDAFSQQKAYIETHVAGNDIEDAALTAKKIELNEWLYQAQYQQERFGGWSGYPESIQDLTPIQ